MRQHLSHISSQAKKAGEKGWTDIQTYMGYQPEEGKEKGPDNQLQDVAEEEREEVRDDRDGSPMLQESQQHHQTQPKSRGYGSYGSLGNSISTTTTHTKTAQKNEHPTTGMTGWSDSWDNGWEGEWEQPQKRGGKGGNSPLDGWENDDWAQGWEKAGGVATGGGWNNVDLRTSSKFD